MLSSLYGWHRAMRIFDGPDEAHLTTLARAELNKAPLFELPETIFSQFGRLMKAVVCQSGELEVRDVDAPTPDRGQLVLSVLACGICGSDLHARHHADEVADAASASGYHDLMRPKDAVVLGHEFCGEVAEIGKGSSKWRIGTLVVAMPIVRAAGAVHLTGLTPKAPGGYAEQVLVQDALTFAVPNGLAPTTAALTEPMAVALHARAARRRRQGAGGHRDRVWSDRSRCHRHAQGRRRAPGRGQ